MTAFQPGNRANPAGRPKGSRTRLNGAFIAALAADFEEHGIEAIRITRIEHPDQYVKIVASLMPREFTLEDNRMTELSDTELDFVIEYAKRQLARGEQSRELANKRELTIDIGTREDETPHGRSLTVLQAVR